MSSRLIPLIVLLAGCAGQPAREPIPHHFSQSLIEVPPLERGGGEERGQRQHTGAVARCRSLVGRTLPGSDATLRLLRACLGPTLNAGAARGDGLELRRDEPEPLDVVLFRGTRPEAGEQISDAGVVLRVVASRVEFVYVRLGTTRVALGALNLAQPHRRRLGRSPRIENSYLRLIRPSDGPSTRYLAGELLAGFATLERDVPRRALSQR